MFLPGASPLHPGRQYDNLDSNFWTNVSDLQSPYFLDDLPSHPSHLDGGSLFCFPLRSTEEQITKLDIIDKIVLREPFTASIVEKK